MIRTASCMTLCTALLILAPTATAGDRVSIQQKDGSRWRGETDVRVEITYKAQGADQTIQGVLREVKDRYLKIDAETVGRIAERVIFLSDIISVRTVDDDVAGSAAQSHTNDAADDTAGADTGQRRSRAKQGNDAYDDPTPGVFVLPLSGTVGIEMRAEEVRKLAEEADKYGPGQILLFEVNSPGGLVTEGEQFAKLLPEIKKRHRCVAWIEEAISGGCAFSVLCDEIYFRTSGTAGSVTMFQGADNTSAKGEELEEWERRLGDWFELGGRSRWIAECMIHAPNLCSYDKNEKTGEVTFYNDLSGEYILSRADENLTFNSSNAVHCGFADGIADTYEEMAEHLDLPNGWHEKSSYGRDLHERWVKTVESTDRDLNILSAQFQYKGQATGDPIIVLGTRIRILERIIKLRDRCEICVDMKGLPPKDVLQREIDDLRYQIAQIRNRQR